MGHEIVYCTGCGSRLTHAQFQQGKAMRFQERSFCLPCAPALAPTLSNEQRAYLGQLLPARAVPTPRKATRRLPLAAEPPSRGPVFAGLAVGFLAIVAVASTQKGSPSAVVAASAVDRIPVAEPVETPTPRKALAAFVEPKPLDAPAPIRPAWKPVFDGKSLDFIRASSRGDWRLDGGLVPAPGAFNAAQTRADFSDVELRVRFESRDLVSLNFSVRQGAEGKVTASWDGVRARGLAGSSHELVFTCLGDQVTALLDGAPVPLQTEGRPRTGCLQFNGSGSGFRVISIESRDPVAD